MASSVSVQDKLNPALWLTTRASKMELSCPLGTTRRFPQEKFSRKLYNKSFIGQAYSVKVAWYWPRSFFYEFMDRDGVEIHKQAKIELGQYPTILTSHWMNNPYIPYASIIVRHVNIEKCVCDYFSNLAVHLWYKKIAKPSKNMRTLWFKAQPTNAFVPTVNQMSGGSSQLLTTPERAVPYLRTVVLSQKSHDKEQSSEVVWSGEEPPNIWLTVAKNAFVTWALNFMSPHVIERRSNCKLLLLPASFGFQIVLFSLKKYLSW